MELLIKYMRLGEDIKHSHDKWHQEKVFIRDKIKMDHKLKRMAENISQEFLIWSHESIMEY